MKTHDRLIYTPLDIVFIGPSGTGKSSTINRLLGQNVASVGEIEPETSSIQSYNLTENVRILDTPGYGDSTQNDEMYYESLKKLLNRQYHTVGGDRSVVYLVDLVVLIIDAPSRDIGTVTWILDKLKSIGFPANRIILVANRVDLIQSKKEKLPEAMRKRGNVLRKRIQEETGYALNKPIFISSNTTENISKLFDEIIDRASLGNRKQFL